MIDPIKFDAIPESPEPAARLIADATAEMPVKRQPRGQVTSMQVDAAEDRLDIDLTALIRIVYKRRWMAMSVFVVIVAVVTVRTFTAVPVFQASARLLIEAENPNVVAYKEVIDEQRANADYYQTQYSILKSRALARKTMEQLHLFQSPVFRSTAQVSRAANAAQWVEWLFGRQLQASTASLAPGADETSAESRAIDAFLGNLTVVPVRTSRLVDLEYSLPDSALATQIVNTLSRAYIDQNLEYKFTASQEASAWLQDRLKEYRAKVETAELALQKYRETNDAISLEDRQNITVQKLSDLNAAVTRAKMNRIEKESLYNQLRTSQGNPTQINTFPAILSNSFVQQLKGQLADFQRQRAQLADRFGDQHPEMIKVNSAISDTQIKLDAEIRKVVQSVKSEFDSALAEEQSLSAVLDQQKSEALSMNRKGIEYSVLSREVDSSKQIYNSLMQRAKETGVSGELRTSNIRVVDAAEQPQSPVSPNKRMNLLAAIFSGGLLGIGLAFAFDYMDNRIKTPDEIKTHLGLPYLGLLPLTAAHADGNYTRLDQAAPVNFSEALRVLRTNVLFACATDGGQTVLVTSTGPGEGKSLVTSNLAIALAQTGQRVLLIDADLRKPKIHTVFGLQQEPGLSNILVGNSKASETVKSSLPGLWLLPSGRIPPNPSELLSSQRFRDFLVSLRTHFDWVIIDSPPVMAVADASVIASLTTGVLFVIGSEMTSRHAARHAVEQVESSHGHFLGAVLNRVDLDHNAYYYSQYYRREYTAYYAKN